jgi:hypothetical protein
MKSRAYRANARGPSVAPILVCVTACVELAACGGTSSLPPEVIDVALAPSYQCVVVTKVLPDGISIDRIEAFELRLTNLQSAGGRVVGQVEVPSRNVVYPVMGQFEADTGRLRFDRFEATLTSTRTELVTGLGGRADDAIPRDGLANTLTGFVKTSSNAQFETDGQFVAVADGPDLPRLDVSKLTAVQVELGKIQISAGPGFAEGAVGLEVFVYSPLQDAPDFRVLQSIPDGSLRLTAVAGLADDIVVVRGLRAARLGPAVWLRVTRP